MTLPTARQIEQAVKDLHGFEAEQIRSMLPNAPRLQAALEALKSNATTALHLDPKYGAVLAGLIMGTLALGINLGARATEIRLDARD